MDGKARFISSGTRFGKGSGAGDGWGGPARGASTAKPRADGSALIPGQPQEKRAITTDRRQCEAEIAVEMRTKLLHLARHADREETQLAAACKLLDRIEGLPVARTITSHDDDIARMTDEELLAEIARATRILGPNGAGPSVVGINGNGRQ